MIFSDELVLRFKMKEADFTRNRKQPFTATLLLLLNFLRKSLAIEIDGFISYLNKGSFLGKTPGFTSSAFIQNRKKINPEVFNFLSSVIIENYYTKDNDALKLFNGHRILAVDGSLITLPYTDALKKCFGVSTNQSKVEIVQARASVLYDVLNGMTLDAIIDNQNCSEPKLALRHSENWAANDLIIYDRGYPSYDFIYEHIRLKTPCLIRVKANYGFSVVKSFLATGKRSVVTEIFPSKAHSFEGKDYDNNTGLKVRLVRVELSTGEVEVLLTTLLDNKEYPSKMFKELYFLRWGVETFYDELKNKLKVEHFSGYSETSIIQDFYCAIFISNLQSVIVNDLKNEIAEQNLQRQYDYKVNANLSYGFLKNRVLELLGKEQPIERVFLQLQELFLKHTIPIRNNRNNPRITGKFKARLKPKVTKNQRDAI
jgi:hypothetical protein